MARAWHLKSRPQGLPTAANFALEPIELPDLEDGMVRVANRWLSVDPYMRGRMNDVKSYVPPFAIDAPLEGGAVGEVVESKADGFNPGDLVVHMAGWRDEAVLPAPAVTRLPDLGVEPQTFLGILGLTGGTAYFGLLDAASAREGDIVFVSAAAGAVGSAVVQVAKAKNMTVIGSARGPDKCEFVRSLGAAAVIDYTAGPLVKSLAAAAPDGIDVYFDNVGGDHLEAALSVLNVAGRVAMCGAIAQYNATEPPAAPRNLAVAIGKQLTLRGFLVGGQRHHAAEFAGRMAGWLADGTVRYDETVVDGLENAPQAFMDMLDGGNTGKMLVRL
jgi:NADPH-dependent curcumin reductase CurA